MAKIVLKSALVLGTNLKLHLVDKGGTNVGISVSGSTITLTASTSMWLASSETAGIVNRPVVIGDVVKIGNTTEDANEGVTATVTNVTTTVITATTLTGSPVTEAAGADINVTALKKYYQFLEAGGLSFVDGVSGITFVSKMVDLWNVTDLDKYDAPFTSIEPRAKSVASINGWQAYNDSTVNAIRDTALEYRVTKSSAAHTVYALLRSTANAHESTDQITVWPSSDSEMTAPQNFVMTGYANQLVKILDTGATIDKRGTWYTRLAVSGKTIVMEQHNLQYAEIYPISAANAIDPKLIVSDVTIAAGGIFANIDFNLDVDSVYVADVNGSNYNFYGYVDADGQSNETVHQKINYLWRQSTNVNSDGTGPQKRGDKQWPLTVFSGDAFTVKSYLLNYSAIQRNNLTVQDNTLANRTWPAIYTLTVTSPALAVGGTMSLIHEESFGTSGAAYMKNEAGIDQKDIPIIASRDIVVAYSTYNTGGHTSNTPLALRLTWNYPANIEPDSSSFTLGPANMSVPISPTANPSYVAA